MTRGQRVDDVSAVYQLQFEGEDGENNNSNTTMGRRPRSKKAMHRKSVEIWNASE